MNDDHLLIRTEEQRAEEEAGMGADVAFTPVLLQLPPELLGVLGMCLAAAFGGEMFQHVYRQMTAGEGAAVGEIEGMRLESLKLLRATIMRAVALEGGGNYTPDHIALVVNQAVPPHLVQAMKQEFDDARALRDAKKN